MARKSPRKSATATKCSTKSRKGGKTYTGGKQPISSTMAQKTYTGGKRLVSLATPKIGVIIKRKKQLFGAGSKLS